jgi:hypothetical protein
MSQIIPFESSGSNLPAYMLTKPLGNQLQTGGGAGFPSISIKGKVFHIRRGDSNTLITLPNDPDAPASSIEVVILNGNPGTAKVWYNAGYAEGSDTKPNCYSNDGIKPAADAAEPQSSSCATCAKNVWGGRISETGQKGRECGDSKRLAVATLNAIEDAMLVRVPAGSLKAFNEYLKFLGTRGVENYQAVVTKIGFDYSVAHPALTFKAVGYVDEGTFLRVTTMVESDLVGQIIGTKTAPTDKAEDESFTPPPPHAAKAIPAPKPAPKVEQVAVAAAPKPAPAPKAAPVVVDNLEEGLDTALDSIDWDG